MELACKRRACFIPFSGNGQCICRRYELGQCPTGEDLNKKKKTIKKPTPLIANIMDLLDLY